MERLLNTKLEQMMKIKQTTAKMLEMSAKLQDQEISKMMDDRQRLMDQVDDIDREISKLSLESSNTQMYESLKNKIKVVAKEIIEMDKVLRRSIARELKEVKTKLSQPEQLQGALNVKA